MAFRYQAIDANGQSISDTIEAGSAREAADRLRERKLFITQIHEVQGGASPAHTSSSKHSPKAGGKIKDVVFFTQQMSMLMRAGAQIVPALEAIEEQTQVPNWRQTVRTIRAEVETGRPLSAALASFPKQFNGVYQSMIAAGEASGDMGLAFDRLATLIRQQQDTRNRIIGAMAYPSVLCVLCVGVIIALFTFVLPRFAEMFKTLDVELPVTTALMISTSDWLRAHWMIALGIIGALVTGLVVFMRSATGKRFLSRFSVRVPTFGRIVRHVILARICRIWGQLLDSKVDMLDAVNLTKRGTTSLDYQELLSELEVSLTDGNAIGPVLKQSWLLPKTFAAAIATGEESGKLSIALLFVASCLEEENTQVLGSLTRIIEPIILVGMGIVVGTAAISLFLPMFDMATVGGG